MYTIGKAPVERLIGGLESLAERLEPEQLHGDPDALSLANELYSQIEDRNDTRCSKFPAPVALPLLRRRQLVSVHADEEAFVLFDDDPGRAKHIPGEASAYRVPVARDAKIDKLYDLFVATWGEERVIRASAAKVDLGFMPKAGAQPFLPWLQQAFPNTDVAVHLAALLNLGEDRVLRSGGLSRNWELFRQLEIEFGRFASSEIKSFYDRPRSLLQLSNQLKDDPPGVVAATWELAGARARDRRESYSTALRDDVALAFLRKRDITDIDLSEVRDAVNPDRIQNIDLIECALLASSIHLGHCNSLDAAETWWEEVKRTPAAVAKSLGRPDLESVIADAVALSPPECELHLVRHLGVPWSDWQAARVRRHGGQFRFKPTVDRFAKALKHFAAVARELAARAPLSDLEAIGRALDAALKQQAPDHVAGLPPESADADLEARRTLTAALEGYDDICDGLMKLPEPPWANEFPMPDGHKATKPGVRLYRDHSVESRVVEARTTVDAVLSVGASLAPALGEQIDPKEIAGSASVARLTEGNWANVYAALAALRDRLREAAPKTTARLSEVRAFHEPTGEESLRALLPELPKDQFIKPPRKREVLGLEFTDAELREDLASGSSGLRAKLAKAAKRSVLIGFLGASRTRLPDVSRNSTQGGAWKGARGGGASVRESELVGDLGEALVHECLTAELGDDYGPECWKSRARKRYDFSAGDDNLGYDFEVTGRAARQFQSSAERVLIEVKSTRTDGSGPFPMSRAEWNKARECHEADDGSLYVIVRVFAADTPQSRIGDVLPDPVAAHNEGKVRLDERDLWVTIARPESPPEATATVTRKSDKG